MATDVEEEIHPSLDKLGLDDSPRSPTILPWDRFSNWLHCACVVTFDLELGQAMELIYPGHIKLTDREKMNICYLSFPDSNSGCMGDTQFHFRIRQCPGRRAGTAALAEYNRDCPAALQTDNAHYYGYVYFRQTKDKSIRRGYFQKSVVLISRLPFTQLFTHLASIVAPEYFDNGEPCLEAACHDIDQWPDPVPGETLNLPIMGSVLQVRIPCRADKLLGISQLRPQTVPLIPANNILPTLHEVDIFSTIHCPHATNWRQAMTSSPVYSATPLVLPRRTTINLHTYNAFQPVLPHIQMLWELVITGEPVIVMAALPTVCSMTVQALVSMIWPLRYCSDYRPYFTIHDSEFKEYTTKTQAPPSVLLGVTNPFFAKTLQHWPHIVRIGEMTGTSPKFNKLKKGGNLKTLDSKPGVYTRYKPFLNKDKTVLKRLAKMALSEDALSHKGVQTKRPVEVQNAMLRRHLLELTQSFMIPLERYVASLMPLQRNISPHKGPPRLKSFDTEEFLKTIDHSGPQLTSGLKGDWVGLYRRFFRSANFEGWLKFRTAEVNQKLQALHAEALCKADLMEWIQDKQEVEVVDLILRLREKLTSASTQLIPLSDDMVRKLQCHLDSIIATLPGDLQSVLSS